MTKMEMVNRMIILGCIKESDRTNMMKRNKEKILEIYIKIIPIRLEYLKKMKEND